MRHIITSFIAAALAFCSVSAETGTYIIDDFAKDKLAGWHTWPKENIRLQLQGGEEKALIFDFRQQSGAAAKTLPDEALKRSAPIALKLCLKAAEGNQRDTITVIIQEKNGEERYYYAVPLTKDWQTHEIPLPKFSLVTYGGAKVKDGQLDPKDIGSVRFESFPAGAVLAVKKMEFLTGTDTLATGTVQKKYTPEIKPIIFPEKAPASNEVFPEKVQNVTIKGRNFFRNGRPVFLIGGWQIDNEGPPWLFRTLDIDLYDYNADQIYSLYPPKVDGNRIEIQWSPNPWYEAVMLRSMRNGLMFWHEHKASGYYNALKTYLPEVVDVGHFFAYDPYNPLGVDAYRELFKTWMQYTRKYPVFCYELFNEVLYNNTKKISRNDFKEAMRKKFSGILAANQAWGTSFQSFEAIEIPGFIDNPENSLNSKSREVLTRQDAGKYPNLYIDWQKFQEKRAGEAFANLMKIMREYDPDSKKFSTIQSHCQLFFDFADAGVHPEAVDENSNFYSHEMAQSLFDTDYCENPANVKDMIKPLLTHDIVRNITNKPIFNAESPISITRRGADKKEFVANDLAGLHGEWKFYDATAKEPAAWSGTDFDDSLWGKINVPGMWGQQGHNQCKTGLYRKTFNFKMSSAEKDKKFYLNGEAFADEAQIYLNGVLIGSPKGFNSAFSFDISSLIKSGNVLAVKIQNNYFGDGMYFGGIRGYVSVNNSGAVQDKPPLEPKHFRTQLWSQFAHGINGVMVCYDSMLYNSAARIIPKVKKEIESVSEIIMNAEPPAAQTALIYPFETNRGLQYSGYIEKLSGPATNDLIDFYAPLLFFGAGLDVIRNKDIKKLDPARQKLLFMSGNIRVPPDTINDMEKYLEKGGTIVADFGSSGINDDTHGKIDASAIFGIKIEGLSKTEKTVLPGIAGDKPVKTQIRFADKNIYADIKAVNAEVIAKFEDGSPAVTCRRAGSGAAWYIAAKLPYHATKNIIEHILLTAGAKPPVSVIAAPGLTRPEYIETRLFSHGKRHVAYILNWGKSANAAIGFNSLPEGNYLVRNLSTGNPLPPPDKNSYWTSDDLRSKMSMKLNSLDPVALLIEDSGEKPLAIKGISPERYEILDQLWAEMESPENAPVIAFSPITSMAPNYGDQPTAQKLLNLNGFKTINYETGKTDLSKLNALIWVNAREPVKDPEPILNFVRNGGGLLICGNGFLNHHTTLNAIMPLLSKLGVNQTYMKWLMTEKIGPDEDLLSVSCDIVHPDPLTEHVKVFKSACSGVVTCQAPDAKVLVKAPADSNIPGAPVMVSFQYGKGRVVYISDYWWLRPLNFEKGDNPQLFLNIINFLTGRPPMKLSDETLGKALYITREKLKNAEDSEQKENCTFAPFSNKKSALPGSKKIQGIAGGDPIVDILN